MQVFRHHMHEFQKGLRHLILHTTQGKFREEIVTILEKNDIPYLIHPAGTSNINVFFGDEECVNVIKKIGKSDLTQYTDEEDFMLGIMLGYDRLKQCERFLERKSHVRKVEELIG